LKVTFRKGKAVKTMLSKLQPIATWMALAAILAAPAVLIAHEGHHHEAMGTVKMLHENHLMLTISEGKDQTFVLSGETKYLRGETAVTREDITAGERAVVMYETEDGADRALEVRLGAKKP